MANVYPDPDWPGVTGVEYPRAVRAAGVIWIVFGGLILLGAAVNLLLTVGRQAGDGATAAGGVCGGLFAAFIGGVFVHVGVQSISGTARDTLGNGIGSILFGVLYAAYGLFLMVGAVAARANPALAEVRTVLAVVAVIGGVYLLCA